MKAEDILTRLPSISVRDAFKRCNISTDQLAGCASYTANDNVRWHDGDLHIVGDLALDWTTHWQQHSGLIVTGSLTVAGNVINSNADNGPFLIVQGQLRAQHAVFGGAEVYIAGGANIQGLLLAYGNDGWLKIDGQTHASLIISDDHATELQTHSAYWNNHGDVLGMPLADYLQQDVALLATDDLPVDEEQRHLYQAVDPALLIQRIQQGQPVLRATDDSRPQRDSKAWQTIVREYPAALQHVPEIFLDKTLAELAATQDGCTLQWVPDTQRTPQLCQIAMQQDPDAFYFVPPALRSEALCWQAIEHDGCHLEQVPIALRTAELCLRAIETDEDTYALAATPADLLTEAMCIIAVQHDPVNLSAVPQAMRSLKVCVAALEQRPAMALIEVPHAIRKAVCETAGYIIKGEVAIDAQRDQAMPELKCKQTQ